MDKNAIGKMNIITRKQDLDLFFMPRTPKPKEPNQVKPKQKPKPKEKSKKEGEIKYNIMSAKMLNDFFTPLDSRKPKLSF